jgi:hypothetical protein
VHHLVREGGSFTAALTQADNARAAIAQALKAIDSDVPGMTEGAPGATGRLEALLLARLVEGQKHGDVPQYLDVSELAAFYTSVAVSLVVSALEGGGQAKASVIRRVALQLLPQPALAVVRL